MKLSIRKHLAGHNVPDLPQRSPVFQGRKVSSGVLRRQLGKWQAGALKHVQAVVLVVAPLVQLNQAGHLPETRRTERRVLEALLDLDALVGLDDAVEDLRLFDGRQESLVAAALRIVDVLADDLPVVDVELVLAKDAVGVSEPVLDELMRDAFTVVVRVAAKSVIINTSWKGVVESVTY